MGGSLCSLLGLRAMPRDGLLLLAAGSQLSHLRSNVRLPTPLGTLRDWHAKGSCCFKDAGRSDDGPHEGILRRILASILLCARLDIALELLHEPFDLVARRRLCVDRVWHLSAVTSGPRQLRMAFDRSERARHIALGREPCGQQLQERGNLRARRLVMVVISLGSVALLPLGNAIGWKGRRDALRHGRPSKGLRVDVTSRTKGTASLREKGLRLQASGNARMRGCRAAVRAADLALRMIIHPAAGRRLRFQQRPLEVAAQVRLERHVTEA
jgi:hypothetical protein